MKKKVLIFTLIFAVSILFITAQEKRSFGTAKKQTETTQQEQTGATKKSFGEQKETSSTAKTTNTKKKNTKLFKGYVVSLTKAMASNYNLTKAEAQKLAAAGSPIVLIDKKSKSGRIYFLVDEGGNFLGKKLANYAVYKKVAVSGKFKMVNRTRFIIVDFIESAE